MPMLDAEDHVRPLRNRRWTIRAVTRRLARRIRWLLGPSTPIPDSKLSRPTPSTSLSFTLGRKAKMLDLDPPISRLNRSLRLRRALIPFLLVWTTANILLIRQQYYLPSPDIISCTASLWDDWPSDICGLNATGCVSELVQGTYRCMGGCRHVSLGNPRWVGDTEVNNVPLVIGGEDESHTYR